MKKQSIILLSALVLGMAACDKTSISDNIPTDPTNPTNPTTPTAPAPPTPMIGDANGILASIQMKFSYANPMLPAPVEIVSEMAFSVFPDGNNSSKYLNVGTVSVNSVDLDKAENNSYTKTATIGMDPQSLEFDGGSNWVVSSLGINYSHTTSFPKFSGTLPDEIDRSSGITVNLSNSLSGNADSVILLIAAGSKVVQKTVGAAASSITLSANELSNLPAVGDNTAFLEVVPYKITPQQIDGKQYYFIKEQAVVKAVNLN